MVMADIVRQLYSVHFEKGIQVCLSFPSSTLFHFISFRFVSSPLFSPMLSKFSFFDYDIQMDIDSANYNGIKDQVGKDVCRNLISFFIF